jgi:predicted regulator of Ras-like GTPase activity (Roadblock/LC7/MglB family)
MSATASKTELLNEVLDSLATNLAGDVNGSAVVSADGIVYASNFPGSVNVDRVGAIAATTLGVSRRVARDLSMGNTNASIIQCENGFFLVVPVTERSLLAVSLRKGGNLGMTRLETSEASIRIAEIMG